MMAEFARQIHQAFNVPGTCILGYNNIRFDDEVSHTSFKQYLSATRDDFLSDVLNNLW